MSNIAKLLKNAPKGLKLYSLLHSWVEFMGLTDCGNIGVKGTCGMAYYNQFGKPISYPEAECLLFPCKGGTWEVEEDDEHDKVAIIAKWSVRLADALIAELQK